MSRQFAALAATPVLVFALVLALGGAMPVLAAGPEAPAIDGRHLGLAWVLPFIGILLSIAILPLAAPRF